MPGKGCSKSGRKHTPTELAYLAGFLDGEGYFSIQNVYTRKLQKYQQKNFRIGAINTNKEVLDWISATFGGSVSSRGIPRSSKHKPSYVWSVCNQKAEDLARLLLPYLKVKRLQAEVGLKFRETFHRQDSLAYEHIEGRFARTYVPQNVVALREDYRSTILSLNRKGPMS